MLVLQRLPTFFAWISTILAGAAWLYNLAMYNFTSSAPVGNNDEKNIMMLGKSRLGNFKSAFWDRSWLIMMAFVTGKPF